MTRDAHSTVGDDTPVPDTVVAEVYGMGFSPSYTSVLACRTPYVLLATRTRPDPYSIVSLTTRRTVERFVERSRATRRLDELARRAATRPAHLQR